MNDKSVRGKCYGFVTFSNRRSADDAIEDMDGKVRKFKAFVAVVVCFLTTIYVFLTVLSS